MKIGKLPEPVLIRSVLKQVKHRREEVLVGPAVGQDCAALEVGEDEVLVMSTDPITGTAKDLGHHSIHITANDLAAAGADPVGVMLTVMLPGRVGVGEGRELLVVGVVGCVCVGVVDIIVTKWIGLEATTILAKEKEEELKKRFPAILIDTAKDFDQYLSVVPESRIAVEHGVSSMHDITEGGVFGAFWEMASGAGVGLEVDLKKIPIRQETVEICNYFGVNPYQIMSSGSMMIAADDGHELVRKLEQAGIHAVVVGRTNSGNDRILRNGEDVRYLDKPQPDELYKVMG